MGRDDKRRNGNCLNGEKFFEKKKERKKESKKEKKYEQD